MHLPPPAFALHTWTLDSTALPEALRVARDAGYDGVELRYLDFMRCRQAGMDEAAILSLIQSVGMPVRVIGTENGVLFDAGTELERLLDSLRYVCRKAVDLQCGVIMMPPGGIGAGAIDQAASRLAACAEITAAHGLKLALEFNSRHPLVRTLESALALVEAVDMPHCGLLVDTYHLHSSGGTAEALRRLPVERIITVQFSDVPAGPPSTAPVAIDRLPPGQGVVQFEAIFRALQDLRYQGTVSYEAPNPAQWERPAATVAREGLTQVSALWQRAARA